MIDKNNVNCKHVYNFIRKYFNVKKKHLRKQTIGCELSSEELLMEWKFKYSYDLRYFQVFAPEKNEKSKKIKNTFYQQ